MSKIRNVLLSSAMTLATFGFASAALASGPVTIVEQRPVTVAAPVQAYSWGGFYGGLSYSRVTGDATTNFGDAADFGSVNGAGAFAGYNWQSGNLVFGGELTYTDFSAPVIGFPGAFQENALELRARAGYAFDRAMVYGFVGAARSRISEGGDSINMNGFSYGIGAQALVTRNMFVGLELARRDLEGSDGPVTVNSDINTVSLRVGFQF
ncbi:MAG: outer membrane protein [Pararhodobacter sp.]